MRTTLRWSPPAACTPELLDALTGSGAPFETVEAEVMGTRHEIFVRRHPHLRSLFDEGTVRHADRPYLVHADRTITFADARQLVANTAAALAEEHGIGHGDHVAIAAANRSEHVIVAWAVSSSAVSSSSSTAGGRAPSSSTASG